VDYYLDDCLLRCPEYLPEVNDIVDKVAVVGGVGGQGRKNLDGKFGGGNGIAISILHGGNNSKPQIECLGYGTNDPFEEMLVTWQW
jgi:hypothetical protein